MGQTIHLLSTDSFLEKAVISEDVNALIVKKVLQNAQSIKLQSLLGTKLYSTILEYVEDGNILVPYFGVYKTLLDEYILPVIQFEGYYRLLLHLHAQVTDKGAQTRSGEYSNAIDMAGLKLLRADAKNDSEFYANLLVVFICDNVSDYPEYTDTTEGIEANKKPFFSGIYFNDYRK